MCDLCDGIYNSSDGGGGVSESWEDVTSTKVSWTGTEVYTDSTAELVALLNRTSKLLYVAFKGKFDIQMPVNSYSERKLFSFDNTLSINKRVVESLFLFNNIDNGQIDTASAGYVVNYSGSRYIDSGGGVYTNTFYASVFTSGAPIIGCSFSKVIPVDIL